MLNIKKNKGFYYRLTRATFARRTLLRFLQNEALSDIEISDKTLDLGGNSKSQYYRYITMPANLDITYADLHDKSENVINMDFTKLFPIQDNTYNNVLLMNVIEHLESYDTCINETKRILKDNGKLIGVVPFLFPVHMVPDDFHRPTESSIHKMLKNAGFNQIDIQPIGYGRWSAAANLCGQKIKFKLFALLLYFLAFLLDKIDKEDNKFTNNKFAFPIGYFFTAK